MKRWALILSLCFAASAMPVLAAAPVWEQVSSQTQKPDSADSDKVDVYVKDGYIYIATSRAVNVKIMSILGQLITQKYIQPGVSRIKISTRGIYILKAGQYTKRVTI